VPVTYLPNDIDVQPHPFPSNRRFNVASSSDVADCPPCHALHWVVGFHAVDRDDDGVHGRRVQSASVGLPLPLRETQAQAHAVSPDTP